MVADEAVDKEQYATKEKECGVEKVCVWCGCVINLFILLHTDLTGPWRQLVLQKFLQRSPNPDPDQPSSTATRGALPSERDPLISSFSVLSKEKKEHQKKGNGGGNEQRKSTF